MLIGVLIAFPFVAALHRFSSLYGLQGYSRYKAKCDAIATFAGATAVSIVLAMMLLSTGKI